MTKVAVRDLGQSALSAFRADIPVGGRTLTPADNETLAVATLLRHATAAPNSVASRRMLREATRVAKQVLGKRRLQQGCEYDTPGHESPLDVIRKLGEHCTASGKARLEDHILVSLERIVAADSLTGGRVRARRVRVAWELGEYDFCQMQSEALYRGDQASPFDEVRLRGGLNLGAVALIRGNMPACQRFARRVLRESGDRYPQIAAGAWANLSIVAAKARDFDKALHYAWKAYDLMKEVKVPRQQGYLINICQILLDTGHSTAARAGFARLLADSPDTRTACHLLGGFAIASGALGDRSGVTWATAQVLKLAKLRSSPRELAEALLECSTALTAVGQDARAGTMRRRSLRLSERYGFHDLIFRAQPTTIRSLPSTSPLTGAAKVIAARVTEMEPDTLPADLVYAD